MSDLQPGQRLLFACTVLVLLLWRGLLKRSENEYSDDRDILVSKHIHVDRALMLSHGAAVDNCKGVRSPHSVLVEYRHVFGRNICCLLSTLVMPHSPHKKNR